MFSVNEKITLKELLFFPEVLSQPYPKSFIVSNHSATYVVGYDKTSYDSYKKRKYVKHLRIFNQHIFIFCNWINFNWKKEIR